MLGNQLPVYLSLENRQNRTMTASLIYLGANLVLNWLFVQVLRMEAFGLALASSAGFWIFLAVQAQVFLGGKSHYKFQFRKLRWPEGMQIALVNTDTDQYENEQTLYNNALLTYKNWFNRTHRARIAGPKFLF